MCPFYKIYPYSYHRDYDIKKKRMLIPFRQKLFFVFIVLQKIDNMPLTHCLNRPVCYNEVRKLKTHWVFVSILNDLPLQKIFKKGDSKVMKKTDLLIGLVIMIVLLLVVDNLLLKVLLLRLLTKKHSIRKD